MSKSLVMKRLRLYIYTCMELLVAMKPATYSTVLHSTLLSGPTLLTLL